MGEMVLYYVVGEVVFIGGSLFLFGGQNLIEVCVVGMFVVIGLYMFNFVQVICDVVVVGVCEQVEDVVVVICVIDVWLLDVDVCEVVLCVVLVFVVMYGGVIVWMVEVVVFLVLLML